MMVKIFVSYNSFTIFMVNNMLNVLNLDTLYKDIFVIFFTIQSLAHSLYST